MSTLILEKQASVATITLNRAEKRNALTQQMWEQLAEFCDELGQADEPPRVLIIKAAGDKAFSAGADIQELTELITDTGALKANNQIVQQAQQKLHQLPFATVAVINGACVGGGMGIALACDFRIATHSSKFAITPSKLGLLYSIEDTRRLVNLVGEARAKQLLFLGEAINAATAEKWGLLTKSVSDSELELSVEQLKEQLLAVSGTSISGVKQTIGYINQTSDTDEHAIRQLFDQAFNGVDFAEGADAFLNKRKPEFK